MISFLYDLLYVLPLYLFFALSGARYIHMQDERGMLCIVALIFVCAVVGFCNLKNRLRFLIPGVISVGAFGMVISQNAAVRLAYVESKLWLLWMLTAAILFYVVGKITAKSAWIRRLVMALLIGWMIYAMCRHIEVDKVAIVLAYLQLLLYVLDEIQLRWTKSGYADKKHHLVYITPFAILICAILLLSPIQEEPYDWEIVISTWEKVVDAAKTVVSWLPGGDDESARVGFSDKAIMRGVIQQYPKELMTMNCVDGVPKIVYLQGKSFDTFAGNEWSAENHEQINAQVMDTIELLCAAKKADSEHYSDYIKSAKVKIKYELFHTQYIFIPQKAETKLNNPIRISYKDMQDSLYANRRIPYGEEYFLSFYRLNSDQMGFDVLIDESSEITKEEWDTCRLKYYFNSYEECTYDDYLRYKQLMKSNYSEEIILSDELQQKLQEVCHGAESDWEKLKRIEAWLGEFRYTMEPGELPDSVQTPSDYLDYFLLEKQEGYCMHYATAFTLLARALGLPSRFVQGLYVNRGNNKTVMVTADNAHAWPEVYFENVGWISFEPTPKYHRDQSWEFSRKNANAEKSSSFDPRSLYEKTSNSNEEKNGDSQGNEKVQKKTVKVNLFTIVIPMFAVVLFILCFIAVYKMIAKRNYQRLDLTARARTACKLNLTILSYLGLPQKEGQTLEELGREVEEKYGSLASEFIVCYEKIIYGDTAADEEMLGVIEASQTELIRILDMQKKYTKRIYHILIVV